MTAPRRRTFRRHPSAPRPWASFAGVLALLATIGCTTSSSADHGPPGPRSPVAMTSTDRTAIRTSQRGPVNRVEGRGTGGPTDYCERAIQSCAQVEANQCLDYPGCEFVGDCDPVGADSVCYTVHTWTCTDWNDGSIKTCSSREPIHLASQCSSGCRFTPHGCGGQLAFVNCESLSVADCAMQPGCRWRSSVQAPAGCNYCYRRDGLIVCSCQRALRERPAVGVMGAMMRYGGPYAELSVPERECRYPHNCDGNLTCSACLLTMPSTEFGKCTYCWGNGNGDMGCECVNAVTHRLVYSELHWRMCTEVLVRTSGELVCTKYPGKPPERPTNDLTTTSQGLTTPDPHD